jgi:hypothetical protein
MKGTMRKSTALSVLALVALTLALFQSIPESQYSSGIGA